MTETQPLGSLSHIHRGEELLQAGQLAEALELATQILAQDPTDTQTCYLIGRIELRMQHYAKAAEHFAYLVDAHPEEPAYLAGLGEALLWSAGADQAIGVLSQALTLSPDDAGVKTSLALAFMTQSQYRRAADLLQELVEVHPAHLSDLHSNLATCYLALGDLDKAGHHARTALDLGCSNPAYVERTLGYITYAMEGSLEEATKHFMRALELNPKSGESFFHYASIRKFQELDPKMIAWVERQLKEDMPAGERARFHFGLGKIYDDLKEWEHAFEHIRRANVIAKQPIDLESTHRMVERSKKLFTRKFFELNAGMGSESEQPIFVLGMPRSGSTLIDQILTSHPQVTTAGELPALPRICHALSVKQENSKRFPDGFTQVDRVMLSDIATKYLEVLVRHGGSAKRVVDKLPGNLFFIGVIRLAFPNARIIHTVRHPLDTCISCFFQPFREFPWSYDLSGIGQYYRLNADMMAHWRKTLPEGTILEAHYERLIEDTEGEAKRIVAHCGLDWDERCLDFHRAQRTVTTASLWQVRQPIYKTSKQRWLNYAPYIEELVKALGPHAASYFDELEAHGGRVPRSLFDRIVRRMH